MPEKAGAESVQGSQVFLEINEVMADSSQQQLTLSLGQQLLQIYPQPISMTAPWRRDLTTPLQ